MIGPRGTVLGIAVLASGASAAIPDSSQVIHACYHNRTGQLRVFDSEDGDPKHCRNGETELTWNQKGEKGDTGPQGPAGPAGPKGDTGPHGEPGRDGVSGDVRVEERSEANPFDKGETVRCPPGTRIIGGGALVVRPNGSPNVQGVFLQDNGPEPRLVGREGWTATARESDEPDHGDWILEVTAICAAMAP